MVRSLPAAKRADADLLELGLREPNEAPEKEEALNVGKDRSRHRWTHLDITPLRMDERSTKLPVFDAFTANNCRFSKQHFAHETGAAFALIVSNTDPPRRQDDFPPDLFYFSPASRTAIEPATKSAAEAARGAWLEMVAPGRLMQIHSEEELKEMLQQSQKGLQRAEMERRALEERLSESEREAKRLRDLGLMQEEGV
ncbi:hypothetical protein C6P46_002154 [Rhodotorula mucilaginosa]|uniref:Uncharacterized protein n=1 Tax=Rhodotorula mucilaginosa TaxID=5537 RepID=A0A9P6VSW1_RHOMI|nr:hypothetical protein C6P46_002154 [Rhodotorula mucilaginosa]